jgi:hypothetical protein
MTTTASKLIQMAQQLAGIGIELATLSNEITRPPAEWLTNDVGDEGAHQIRVLRRELANLIAERDAAVDQRQVAEAQVEAMAMANTAEPVKVSMVARAHGGSEYQDGYARAATRVANLGALLTEIAADANYDDDASLEGLPGALREAAVKATANLERLAHELELTRAASARQQGRDREDLDEMTKRHDALKEMYERCVRDRNEVARDNVELRTTIDRLRAERSAP